MNRSEPALARVTVFDDGVPSVANLDPDLLDALRRAATDASDDGREFVHGCPARYADPTKDPMMQQ
ncbi:hypothetical protein ACIA8C_09050 [Nocardia sp. NPDC051321]|uniref:hypothetical protein n=1 Tax=Nocardia sp. NPDC051321 TaxID=3364323 RepID=UPI0037919E7D